MRRTCHAKATLDQSYSNERVVQIATTSGTVTERTTYVGALYERVSSTGGRLEHKHYIMAPTGRVAVFSQVTGGSPNYTTTRWFHTDGLGSVTVVSDEAGRVLKRYAYDAWGKQTATYTNPGAGLVNTAPSTRGFTDHEMLNDFGLIHMNGRVYDATLGRFISADPNVDGAHDGQGYNRYSYVGNNPTGSSDPTGYFKLKDILPALIAVVVTAVVVVAVVMSGGTLAAGTGFFQALGAGLGNLAAAVAGGAAGGFAGGFSGSLLNGGSIGDAFKAGVIGAAVGAATAWAAHGIGGFFDQLDDLGFNGLAGWGGRTAAHATVGGLASEAQGGSFRHGFYSSAASTGIMHAKGVGSFMGGSKGGAWIAARTAAAAAIGGTASVLSGGKFANGATTSAFQHLFNAEAPKIDVDKNTGSVIFLNRELASEKLVLEDGEELTKGRYLQRLVNGLNSKLRDNGSEYRVSLVIVDDLASLTNVARAYGMKVTVFTSVFVSHGNSYGNVWLGTEQLEPRVVLEAMSDLPSRTPPEMVACFTNGRGIDDAVRAIRYVREDFEARGEIKPK